MPQLKVTPPEGAPYTIQLQTKYAMIGRGPTCEVRLPVRSISLHHAKLDLSGASPYLIDLGSTNGTKINQAPLEPNGRIALQDQDVIEVGTYRLLFLQEEPQPTDSPDELARALAQDTSEDQRPFLLVLNGPQAGLRAFFPEPSRQIIIGRGDDCELSLVDAGASRRHAMIQRSMGGTSLTDLGSRHGTTINQTLLQPNQSIPIKDQAEITIGQTRIRFSDPEEAMFASVVAPKEETAERPNERPIQPKAELKKEAPVAAAWVTREIALLGVGASLWALAMFFVWEALR